MFISSCTTIKDYFFFKCLYFSEYDIRMFLYVFWLRNRPSIKYVRNWENGGEVWLDSKCVQVHTEGEGYHTLCVRTHLHYLFSCFYLMVYCFICRNLTLASFKKGAFVSNGDFSPNRSISVVIK